MTPRQTLALSRPQRGYYDAARFRAVEKRGARRWSTILAIEGEPDGSWWWHSSVVVFVSGLPVQLAGRPDLAARVEAEARALLEGVGDPDGEQRFPSPTSYHLRRKLSQAEAARLAKEVS